MKKIDAHIHYVDFIQETEGFSALLRKMDENEIEKAVVFGLPVKKKWSYFEAFKPSYYLDGYSSCYYYTATDEMLAHAYSQLTPESQSRLSPLLCGFDPTDKFNLSYIKNMMEKYPFWNGVGEMLLRHDELSLHTFGELPRINHECLDGIFDYCEKNKLPVLVHHNVQSVGYKNDFIYHKELEDVLIRFKNLKLVWAHLGLSRRTAANNEFVAVARDLFSKYPNLHGDISWVVYEDEIWDEQNHYNGYVRFIDEFADRIMIGSDLTGHFDDHPKEMNKYEKMLAQLKPEKKRKIAYENAEQLYFPH